MKKLEGTEGFLKKMESGENGVKNKFFTRSFVPAQCDSVA
jgi:hypothetical protein